MKLSYREKKIKFTFYKTKKPHNRMLSINNSVCVRNVPFSLFKARDKIQFPSGKGYGEGGWQREQPHVALERRAVFVLSIWETRKEQSPSIKRRIVTNIAPRFCNHANLCSFSTRQQPVAAVKGGPHTCTCTCRNCLFPLQCCCSLPQTCNFFWDRYLKKKDLKIFR